MGNRPFSDSTSVLSFLCYAPSLKQAGPPAYVLFERKIGNSMNCVCKY